MNVAQIAVAAVALSAVTLHLTGVGSFSSATAGDSANRITGTRLVMAVVLPVAMAVHGLRKGSLDMTGAVAGFAVGCALTLGSYSCCAAVITFYLAASKATKFGSKQKKHLEEHFKEGGQRNWVQVLCNGGVPAVLAAVSCWLYGPQELALQPPNDDTSSVIAAATSSQVVVAWRLTAAILCSAAAAAGDTFSSELGPVLSTAEPRLITTMRRVPRGTNGGVTLAGTAASAFGGAVVGLMYAVTQALVSDDKFETTACLRCAHAILVASLSGLLGSVFDSFLGATIQYSAYDKQKNCIVERPCHNAKYISGRQLLDNHGVNAATCIAAALAGPALTGFLWRVF